MFFSEREMFHRKLEKKIETLFMFGNVLPKIVLFMW